MHGRAQHVRILAATLCASAGWLAGPAVADPYHVEVLVFARPADLELAAEGNDHQPGCLARAQPPAGTPVSPGAPATVGPEGFHLVTEAQALQRSSSGLRVLAHIAWQQEVPATAPGPWVRIGGRADSGLSGCLRARLTPVPQIEIDLVHETTAGERHSLFGTAKIRPGDVQYFDSHAIGTLVRMDTLTPTWVTPTADSTAPSPAASPAVQPAPATASPPPGATPEPTTPVIPPPPPKKPFRW